MLVLLLSCAVALTGLTACKDKEKNKTIDKPKTEIQQQDDNSQKSQQSPTDQTQVDNSKSQSDSQVQSGTQTDKQKSTTAQDKAGDDKSKANSHVDSGSQKSRIQQ